jgi:hypothetical protein
MKKWCLHCERVSEPVEGEWGLSCGYDDCDGRGEGFDLFPWLSNGVNGFPGFGMFCDDPEDVQRVLTKRGYPAEPLLGVTYSLYPPRRSHRRKQPQPTQEA